MVRSRVFPIPLLIVIAGCSGQLAEKTFPTGSQSIVGDPAEHAVYAVDGDAGIVTRYDTESEEVSKVSVGVEPSRLARGKDKLWVTLRAGRAVAELATTDGALSVTRTIAVGAEPVGIVAREDGKKLYVALSMEDAVIELDGTSLSEVRRWSIAGHPEWLALHPSGDALFVGSALGGRLSSIDTRESNSVTTLDLPYITGAGEDHDHSFDARITGDPWVSADGGLLMVPTLYADTLTPADDPAEALDGDGGTDTGFSSSSGGYGSAGLGLSRFNPGVAEFHLDAHGKKIDPDPVLIFVAGFSPLDGEVNTRDSGGSSGSEAVRSYLTSVTIAPDGRTAYATMEASHTVVAMSTTVKYDTCNFCRDSGMPSSEALVSSAQVFVLAETGPRGVAFYDVDHAFVHNGLDHSMTPLSTSKVTSGIDEQYETDSLSQGEALGENRVVLTKPTLPEDIETGRRLFYSADNPGMAGSGAGVSCSTCHFEGRNDGLTWTLETGRRQTPSLAGMVSGTAPFTWTASVPTIEEEVMITSQGRMGGEGVSDEEKSQISAYIDWSRGPDIPDHGRTSAAITRGQALFERADTACASCHAGELATDNDSYDLFGLQGVNTPSLRGIAATAPYLHDGSADTLRDLLDQCAKGRMGDCSTLSEQDFSDLEAYLRTR